jgi:hypothetical protein
MDFEIIGELTEVVTIAAGTGVRDRARLMKGLWTWQMAKAQRSRESSTSRSQNTPSRDSLVRSSWDRKKEFKLKLPFLD